MPRSLLLGTVLLSGCFGSLSPDRSPTGPGAEVPGPPPAAPLPPPPPVVAIAELKVSAPARLSVGSSAQVTITALDASGKVVSHATLHLEYSSRNPAVLTISPQGLVTGVTKGQAMILVYGGDYWIEKSVQVVD